MMKQQELECFALKLKALTLESIMARGFGHLGGSFSIIETLSVLFGDIMNIDPAAPLKADRDYFVLSKGHAGPAYYAALAAKGYFPESELTTLNRNHTNLPSHPDRNKTKGVDCTTGSLAQGISQAAGIAYGLKLRKMPNRVFCIVGDGECNEGQVWEALQFIQNKRLDNLIVFIDNNKQQVDGYTAEVSFKFDFPALLKAMGYHVESVDGASLVAIRDTVKRCLAISGQAKVIILDTKKSQSLGYYEGRVDSHHLKMNDEDMVRFQKLIDGFEQERAVLEHDLETK